ncbi:lysylphosphatidylglycerol synthase transmembrane domain-containing protein [Pelagovum pacificum]|nr:lysylphosphatidylglycerol synthase transmembrane domain-containing protein [Pelagovum pacificum]
MIRTLLPVAALALVIAVVDFEDTLQQLRDARGLPLIGALVLSQVVIVASALRWHVTVTALGQTLPVRRAIGEYYVSSLLNIILPGGVGGDAARVFRVREATTTAPVLRGVMIERLSGQVALAFVLLAGLIVGATPGGTDQLAAAFIVGLLMIVLVLWAGGTLPGRAGRALGGLSSDLRRLAGRRASLFALLLLNIAVISGLIGCFWLCAIAVGTPVRFTTALVLFPICLAAMLVPVGIGGLGLREGAAAALWPIAGFAAEAGVAASLLFAVVNLAGALPGLYVLMRPHSASDRREAR